MTGPTGHVGSALVRTLLQHNHDVRCIVYDTGAGLLDLPVERIPADLRLPSCGPELFEGCDTVCHLAAAIDIEGRKPLMLHELNVMAPSKVLRLAAAAGVKRMVHVSSVHALDPHPRDGVLTEDRPLAINDQGAYNRSKARGEQLLRETAAELPNIELVVVRPTGVIGPHDEAMSSRMTPVIRYFARFPGLPVPRAGFDFVDVRDVANGILLAMEKGTPDPTGYLLGNHYVTFDDIRSTLAAIRGVSPSTLVVPLSVMWVAMPISMMWAAVTGTVPVASPASIRSLSDQCQVVSSDRAKRELGYTTRPLQDTLADTLTWLRSRGLDRSVRARRGAPKS